MKKLIKCLFLFFLIAGFTVPKPTGYVNDYAGVLTPEIKNEINLVAEKLSNSNIAELAVLIVNSTEGVDDFQYAQAVFDNWKIGKKGVDNGILIFVAMKERKVRIHTGYGIEGIITDGTAGEIIDNYIIPYFKQGKFGEGILNGSLAIAKILDKEGKLGSVTPKKLVKKRNTIKQDFIIFVFAIIVILNILLTRLFGVRRRGRYYGGGGYFGGFGGFGGGGFGGFGGGMSGGGGAGRSW
ncbi:MAG: TPM domain-containing protein [Proteobacteria bacterium]|nr:TPM domain-containing protein [Pseudomonadota bacterium]